MTISLRLKEFLDSEGVKYEHLQHPEAYSAQEIAGAQHISGKNVIKSVIVSCNGSQVMCVLPAIHMIDFDKFKALTGSGDVALVSEEELGQLFPDYELGAEPPFGALYGLDVYLDELLEQDEDVVFNAGTHTDMVRMSFADYRRLVNPKSVADFGRHV